MVKVCGAAAGCGAGAGATAATGLTSAAGAQSSIDVAEVRPWTVPPDMALQSLVTPNFGLPIGIALTATAVPAGMATIAGAVAGAAVEAGRSELHAASRIAAVTQNIIRVFIRSSSAGTSRGPTMTNEIRAGE